MRKRETFWGILFVLGAVLIILNQFGFLAELSMFQVVTSVILAGFIIRNIPRLNFWFILFPAAGLCILFAEELNITGFTPMPALLTALLLSIGLSMIFKKSTHMFCWDSGHGNRWNKDADIINEQDDATVTCNVNFGEVIKYVNSEDFRKANVHCSFGQAKLYFDQATISSGTAVINISLSFGSVILFLPKDWSVTNHTSSFFGESEISSNSNTGPDSPEVILQGNINFGELSIVYI